MLRTVAILSCVLAAVGCSGTDEIFLSPSEAQELEVNFEAALEAQHLFAEHSFEVARGDVDISGYVYDPPTALNNWVGTLSMPGATLPFGTGDGTIVFTAVADGVPVDPYATDITGATLVEIEVFDAQFTGTSASGAPLDISAAFDMSTILNTVDTATTVVDGAFTVVHDGYEVVLDATDVHMDLDLVAEEVTNVTGHVAGTVDIPDFAFDGDFDVDGLGNRVRIGIDVAATTIDYFLDLSELF
jgi:hypothetical protein